MKLHRRLIGAALGSIAAIMFMEWTSYAYSVTAPSIVALLAATAFAMAWKIRWAVMSLAAATIVGIVASMAWYADAVEPKSDPHFQVRDYGYERSIVEVWHDWNSFTRVGALRDLDDPDAPVIGIVQVGTQAHADRYTYLPLVGLHWAVVEGLARLIRGRPGLRRPLVAVGVILLGTAALGHERWR